MKKQSGFTFIEIFVTLGIAAILVAVGVPSLRTFIQSARITTVTNELVSALHVARSEAIRQNSTVCVCPTTDVTAAVPACVNSVSWETGWIAFLDANGNCAFEGGTDNMLKVWDGRDYGGQMTVRNNNATINGSNTIVFNGRGEPQLNGVPQQGTFSVCDDRPVTLDTNGNSRYATAVILGVSGQVRSSRAPAMITYTAP